MQLSEDEGARAVDRVEHPGVRALALLETMLLAENAVIRVDPLDLAANRRLRFAIGDRDGVESSSGGFVVNAKLRAKQRQDLFARHIRQMNRKGEKFVQIRHRYAALYGCADVRRVA